MRVVRGLETLLNEVDLIGADGQVCDREVPSGLVLAVTSRLVVTDLALIDAPGRTAPLLSVTYR